MANWHYMKNGVATGPVTSREVAQLVHRGELRMDDPIRSVESEQWQRIQDEPELMGLIQELLSAGLGNRGGTSRTRAPVVPELLPNEGAGSLPGRPGKLKPKRSRLVFHVLLGSVVLIAMLGAGASAGSFSGLWSWMSALTAEGQAKTYLAEGFDDWVAGVDSSVHDHSFLDDSYILLDYEIKSFRPLSSDSPEFSRLKSLNPSLIGVESGWSCYSAAVNLTFQSKGGDPILKRYDYFVSRDSPSDSWEIFKNGW